MIPIYFLIGLAYVLVNVFVRKMEPDDPLLVLVWWFLWPICLFAWLAVLFTMLAGLALKWWAERKL